MKVANKAYRLLVNKMSTNIKVFNPMQVVREMPTQNSESKTKLDSSDQIQIHDMGGTRSGRERRQKEEGFDGAEKRSGRDRRRGFDRRSNIERRRSNDRRHGQSFWKGELIERREAYRKPVKH